MRDCRKSLRAGVILAVCCFTAVASVGAGTRRTALEPPRYTVDVAIDFDAGTYAGSETVRYTNRTGQSVGELFFNLYPNVGARTSRERLLIVHSVRSGDTPLKHLSARRGIRVVLNRKLGRGETIELTLDFRGRAVQREAADVGLNAHVTDQVAIVLAPNQIRPVTPGEATTLCDDALVLGNPFPVLSVQADEGWDRDVRAGSVAFAEAASWTISVDTEAGVDVIAPGTLASGDAEAGRAVFSGEALRSVALFATRGFERRTVESAGVRITAVYAREHEPAATQAIEIAKRGLAFFSEEFGASPFPEIVIVEAPLPPGHPSECFSGFIAVASAYFTDQNGPEGADLPGFLRDTPGLAQGELEFALLGDLARQWWGEAVGSDPQADAFLTEGLSAYSAIAAIEHFRGQEAADHAVEMRLRTPYRVFRMFGGSDGSADRRAGDLPNYFAYAATLQTKSGLFVRSVRDKVGAARFREGLRQFYSANRGQIVQLADFRTAIVLTGDRTGRNQIDKLYGRWIEEQHGDEDIAAPDYSVAVSEDVAGTKDARRKPGVERFGRFILRQFAFVGKQVAKPF